MRRHPLPCRHKQMSQRFRYGAAAMRCVKDGVLSIAQFGGPLTHRVLPAFCLDVPATEAMTGISARVMSYQSTLLTVTGELMYECICSQIDAGRLVVPCAIVATADTAAAFETLAELLARHGVIREVFVELSAAVEWAQKQAARVQAQAIYVSRRPSR